MRTRDLTLICLLLLAGSLSMAGEAARSVPTEAPRTWVLAGEAERFADFSQSAPGRSYFGRLQADFDRHWMALPFPEEPVTYGDPDPRKRTREMVDKWRAMQDLTGQVTAVAEGATLLWRVTGEDRYLQKARTFLVEACRWDPLGATGIDYNDEAHFRLFRKLPAIYDQIRDHLPARERAEVVAHLRERGKRNFASILEHGVADLVRNSVEREPASHSVRFMPMTGLAALALWDDIPEAREWWEFVYTWYRDVFTPWGGDDGGWAEGVAYWRGVYEHGIFQDALLAIGDPLAYRQPFWANTGLFQVYFVQPYLATSFGDLSNAGQFFMEPGVRHFLEHLGRVTGKGAYISWAQLYASNRPLPQEMGAASLNRMYPTAAEYWVREFIAAKVPVPATTPLADLPDNRHFEDIGWVALHSDLGNPAEDIMLAFKSSPYGSFSHSHADQNAFIINAFGEQLAINSGYREYHRSQMHKYYTRQTLSKNAILINRHGQEVQDKTATGRIVRFEETERTVWTTGDATVAYNTRQSDADTLSKVLRDIVFVDRRYFVIRDHVVQRSPGRIDWLLHARDPITYHEVDGSVVIQRKGVALLGRLVAPGNDLNLTSWEGFPIDPDPKYADPAILREQSYLTEIVVDQAHFQANTLDDKADHVIFAVLWPTRRAAEAADFKVRALDRETLLIHRPDGRVDRLRLTDEVLELDSVNP